MLKNMKIGTKITLGFTLISALLISMVTITIIKVNSTTKINNKVINLRVPTAMSSIEMINGMNHSLAALRGWIILGKDRFKDERNIAWTKEIEVSLKTMTKFSKNWTNPQNVERLNKITSYLNDFKKYQKEIEDIAHKVENQPALKILFKDAAPQADILISNITKIIDLELQQPATVERKALLGMMADVRGTTGVALSNIRAYLLSGDDKFKKLFDKFWKKNIKSFNDLKNNSHLLTKQQKKAFNKFSDAQKIFAPLPSKMFKIRGGNNWNIANLWLGTKAAPIAFKIKEELDAMIKNQKALMKNDIKDAHKSSSSLITLEWVLLIIGLLLSVVISISIRKMIISSISNFQEGLLYFFQYLNREKDYVKLLDDSSSDEIGIMVKVVNENINKTKIGIEEDRKTIEYATLVQSSLLPANKILKKNFSEYFVLNHKHTTDKSQIYTFEKIRDGEFIFMIIDCGQDGIQGMFSTMLVDGIRKQMLFDLQNQSDKDVSTKNMFKYFNTTMKELLKQDGENSISNAGFDSAIVYYNKKENILKYSGANTPLVYIQDNQTHIIYGSNYSVGYKDCESDYEYEEHDIDIQEGIQFYLSTKRKINEISSHSIFKENYTKSFKEQKEIFEDEFGKDLDESILVGFKIDNKSKVILEYEGEFTQNLVNQYIETIEDNIENIGIMSNISTAFAEQFQNAMNYAKSKDIECLDIIPAGYINVQKNTNNYTISSRNILSLNDKEKIEPKLIEILSLDRNGIRKRYRELRKSGENTHAKGGGIGFYEIAKRCTKIEYKFEKINEDRYDFYFTSFIGLGRE